MNSEGLVKSLITPTPAPPSKAELCVTVVIKSVSFDGRGVGGGWLPVVLIIMGKCSIDLHNICFVALWALCFFLVLFLSYVLKMYMIWSTGLLQNLSFNFTRKSYLHLREYLFKKKKNHIYYLEFILISNVIISVLHLPQRCSSSFIQQRATAWGSTRGSCLSKMEPIHFSPHSDQKACFKTNVVRAIICLCLQHLIQLLFLLF